MHYYMPGLLLNVKNNPHTMEIMEPCCCEKCQVSSVWYSFAVLFIIKVIVECSYGLQLIIVLSFTEFESNLLAMLDEITKGAMLRINTSGNNMSSIACIGS